MDVDIKKSERALEILKRYQGRSLKESIEMMVNDLDERELEEVKQGLKQMGELFHLAENKLLDAFVRVYPPLDGLSHGDKDKG